MQDYHTSILVKNTFLGGVHGSMSAEDSSLNTRNIGYMFALG